MNYPSFLLVVLIWSIANIFSTFFIHSSCFIARKTNKKVCACWDCKNPCELWKYDNLREKR